MSKNVRVTHKDKIQAALYLISMMPKERLARYIVELHEKVERQDNEILLLKTSHAPQRHHLSPKKEKKKIEALLEAMNPWTKK